MKHDCAIALCNLTGLETEVRMMQEGALPAILSVCSSTDEDDQILAAQTLAALSSVKDNQGAMVQEGVVPALAMLARNGPVEVKRVAAAVFTNLAAFKANQVTMVKDDAIPCLIDLVKEDDDKTLEHVAQVRR